MISAWEILPSPTDRDPLRTRVRLQAEPELAERFKQLYARRMGSLWAPQTSPFTLGFFLYRLTAAEREELERIVSGQAPWPEVTLKEIPAEPVISNMGADSTQEVRLLEAAASSAEGSTLQRLRIGYFVPEKLPDAPERLQSVLARTLWENKIRANFENAFAMLYPRPTHTLAHDFLRGCRKRGIRHAIAVGDPVELQMLAPAAEQHKILVRILPTAVVQNNVWVSLIAEMLSWE